MCPAQYFIKHRNFNPELGIYSMLHIDNKFSFEISQVRY